MTPHPQRCETCTRDHTDHLCRYRNVRLAERDKEFLEVVGCASHSDSEQHDAAIRAEMLGEIYQRLMAVRTEAEGIDVVTVSDIDYLFAALRQQGGEPK